MVRFAVKIAGKIGKRKQRSGREGVVVGLAAWEHVETDGRRHDGTCTGAAKRIGEACCGLRGTRKDRSEPVVAAKRTMDDHGGRRCVGTCRNGQIDAAKQTRRLRDRLRRTKNEQNDRKRAAKRMTDCYDGLRCRECELISYERKSEAHHSSLSYASRF